MTPILDSAEKLSHSSASFAFFVALIVLGLATVWLVRWLVGQNQKLVDALNASHAAYQGELKAMVAKNHEVITANTEATVVQNDLLRRIEAREMRRGAA